MAVLPKISLRVRNDDDTESPVLIRKKFIHRELWVYRPRRVAIQEDVLSQTPARARTTLSPLVYSTFRASARGAYRIFNAAKYRFYRSNSAPPSETDSPFETASALPYTSSATFSDGTWYLSMSYFNGVLDSGFLPLGSYSETYVKLEIASGVAVGDRPGAPVSARLEQRAGGVIRVIAVYSAVSDGANRATEWTIAYTTNGTTPASDAPTIAQSMGSGAISILAYDLPAQADGVTVKVALQVRRTIAPTYLYSEPATILSALASATGPSAPLSLSAWSGALPEDA